MARGSSWHNYKVYDIQVAPAEQDIVLDVTIANRSLAALAEHSGVAAVAQALLALPVLPLRLPLDGASLAGLRAQIAQWQLKGQQHGTLHAALALDASCIAGKISGSTMPSIS